MSSCDGAGSEQQPEEGVWYVKNSSLEGSRLIFIAEEAPPLLLVHEQALNKKLSQAEHSIVMHFECLCPTVS